MPRNKKNNAARIQALQDQLAAAKARQPPQRTTSRRARRRGRVGAGMRPTASILPYLNPWSSQGPQRIPDEFSVASVAYRFKSYFNMELGEDSAVPGYYRGGFCALPRLAVNVYKPTYTATNQLPITAWSTFTAGYFLDRVSVTDNFHKFRIVNWGVRFVSTGPALNARGRLVLGTLISESPTSVFTGPNGSYIKRMEIPIQPGMDVIWLSEPVDNRAREYYDSTSTAAELLDRWSVLHAFVESAGADTEVRAEIVLNAELIPYSGGFAAKLALPALPDQPGVVSAIRNGMRALGDVYEVTAESLRDSSFVQHMSQQFVGAAARTFGAAAGGLSARYLAQAPAFTQPRARLTWY